MNKSHLSNKLIFLIIIPTCLALLSACSQPTAIPAETESPDIGSSESETPQTVNPSPTIDAGTNDEAVQPTSPQPGEAEAILPAPVIYFGKETGQEPGAPGRQNLWRLEADGQTKRQITHEQVPVTDFDVSPADGSIVYTTFDQNDIIYVNNQGEERRVLVDGPDLSAAQPGDPLAQLANVVIAPDGNTVAFGLGGIMLVDINGNEPRLMLSNQADDSGKHFYYPLSWSPDGMQLLFSDAIGGGLYLMATDDGALIKVNNPTGPFYCCNPSWSLDGKSLYFGGVVYDQNIFQAPGLWQVIASNGLVETLIPGYPNPADAMRSGLPLALINNVQQLDDGLLYAYAASGSYEDLWFDETGNSSYPNLQMSRFNPDGSEPELLRQDDLQVSGAIWAPDASGALVNVLENEQFSSDKLIWVPSDGSSVYVTGANGLRYRWGQ